MWPDRLPCLKWWHPVGGHRGTCHGGPSPGESGKPVTLVELAHVVTRHAAVLRKVLHAEEVMGVLGLKPYTFHGDV